MSVGKFFDFKCPTPRFQLLWLKPDLALFFIKFVELLDHGTSLLLKIINFKNKLLKKIKITSKFFEKVSK